MADIKIKTSDGKTWDVPSDKASSFLKTFKGSSVVSKQPEKASVGSVFKKTSDVLGKGLEFGSDVLKSTVKFGTQAALAPVDIMLSGFGSQKKVTPKIVGGSLVEEIKGFADIDKYKTDLEAGIGLVGTILKPTALADIVGLSALPKSMATNNAKLQTIRLAKQELVKQLERESAEQAVKLAETKALSESSKAVRSNVEKRGSQVILREAKPDLDLTKQDSLRSELASVKSEISKLKGEGVGQYTPEKGSPVRDVIRIDADMTDTNISRNILDLRSNEIEKVLKTQETRLNTLLKKETELQSKLLKQVYNIDETKLDSLYARPKNITKPSVKSTTAKPLDDIVEDILTDETSKGLMGWGVGKDSVGTGKLYSQHLASIIGVFNKAGKAGQEMVKRIFKVSDVSEMKFGTIYADYKILTANALKTGITKEELGKLLVNILEGRATAPNQVIAELADFAKQTNRLLSDDALSLGTKLKAPDGSIIDYAPRDNFFPHIHDIKELVKINKSSTKRAKFIQQIADEQGLSLAEADELFNKFIGHNHKRFIGSLQHARSIDLPNYRTDLDALPDYWKQAFHRTEEIRQFGVFDEIGDALVKKMGEDGADPTLMRKMFERVTGQDVEEKIISETLDKIRGFNSVTLLQTTQITQLAQLAPAMAKFGVFKTLGALAKTALSPRLAKDFALRRGTLLNSANEIANTNSSLANLFYNKLSGIKQVDNFMRTVTTHAADSYVDDIFTKLLKNPEDKKLLRDFAKIKTIDIEEILKRGKMTADEKKLAVKFLTDLSQVRARTFELPLSWSTDTGKTITQLKSFTFGFQRFLKVEILDEAIKGNIAPLIRLAMASQASGEVITDLKYLATGKNIEDRKEGLARIIENYGQGLTFGILMDLYQSAEYGAGAIAKGIAGVTVATASDTISALYQLINKHNPDPAFKMVLRRIPVIGSTIKNLVSP